MNVGELLAKWLYGRLERMHRKPDRILHNSAVREDLQTLEPAGNTQERQKDYVIKKLSICSMIVGIGVIFSIALWIKDGIETEIVDNSIERNLYGDGSKKVSLIAEDGDEEYCISLDIEEKSYTDEELMQMIETALPDLERSILGENESIDKVAYDLRLVKSVDGYPFDVEWRVDEEYLDYEGHLVKDRLDAPVPIELTAVISCGSFALEHTFSMMICSKAVQPGKAELMERQISEQESNSRSDKKVTLPSEIGGQKIHWSYKRSYRGLLLLAATPLLVFLVYFGRDRDLHRQVEDREEQMRLDYPEIVSSLALLIGAGMTVPNAWMKIAGDYKNRKAQTGRKRYAYEEMLLTIYEMESGVSQMKAYEHFGRRCRIPSYNKLATLLSQNIRKGAANLPLLLREESKDAFEERKHLARSMGEKAGTKLLVPMMMLLGITLVIIMVPAFQTYF